ncbi:MAG: hypothetical protein EPO02_13070 [Nitrospirae bacterium]|nr:MAG: hypothetical protein EPO02_13070 [Nitrospirota bacterium]
MDSGIVKIVGEHDRWQSNLVAAFERALDEKLRRAEAKLLSTLMRTLQKDADATRFARSPANAAAIRWLGPAFERQLASEGYGTLVTAFVGQFPAQFEFFQKTLSLLKLPRIDWAAADERAFRAQQIASIDALQSVVKAVGENAKRRALMNIGGLKVDQLAELLQSELGKTLPQATGLAETATSIFYRTIAERGYARFEDAGIEVKFRYYGPDDRITRPFCKRLVESGKAYDRAAIDAMDNGQVPNVFISAGGYRCRHQWILAIDSESQPGAERDTTPPARKIAPVTQAAGRDRRTGAQVREQLAAKAARLTVKSPYDRAEQLRDLLYAENPAKIEMDMRRGGGARKEFRRLRWTEGLAEFKRLVGSGTADGLTAKFRATTRERVFYDPVKKAVSIQTSTSVKKIIHELGHWLEDHVPAIKAKAAEFLARRTQGEVAQSLRSLTGHRGYASAEVAKPDRFLEPYIGKVYRDGYTEVVSMGLELMWSDPERLMTDSDYFDFLWELIRGS